MDERTRQNLAGRDGADERTAPAPRRGARRRVWLAVVVTLVVAACVVAVLAGVLMRPGEPTGEQRLAAAEQKFGELGELRPDEQTILSLSRQEDWMGYAARAYARHCAACHGVRGQGMSGPNLTDDHYIAVRTVEDIHDVIANGHNRNAMPAWRTRLEPNEIVLLSAYVAKLRGRDLPGRPVDRRAVPIAPWPEAERGAGAGGRGRGG